MQTDVLIVGGAAVGSAAAFFLASQPDFKGNLMVVEQDQTYEKSATAVADFSYVWSCSTTIKLPLKSGCEARKKAAALPTAAPPTISTSVCIVLWRKIKQCVHELLY